jgi:AcrR family transcriptional regulator
MTHVANSRSERRNASQKSGKIFGKTGLEISSQRQRKSTTARISNSGGRRQDSRLVMASRRSPKQKRAFDTSAAILTAAEQLLVRVGYANASTNAIARRAGVSIGTLYQYFADKAAIFRAVVERHRLEVKPIVFKALMVLANPATDLVEVMLQLMRDMALVNAKNPKLMAAIDTELGWLERENADDMQAVEATQQVLAARSALSGQQLETISLLLAMTVSHLSRWLVHGKPAHLESEPFIAATGNMLRAIVPPSRCRSRRSNPTEQRLKPNVP